MDTIDARFRLAYPEFSLDVDLRLPGRGVTALFGQSGSGKTTLLRCIAGLERSPEGRLVFKGETWQDGATWVPTDRRPIGYVFQEASLFPHMTVHGNLRYGQRRSRARNGSENGACNGTGERVSLEQAVELLGIGHLLRRRPGRLSGGERQRVGIARALAVSPRVLLMDEPLTALDHARKQEILPYLERLHDELSIPVLYVSHAPDEVARLADHIVVLDKGRALASGPLSETLARLDLPIRLGEDAGVMLEGRIVERDTRWHLKRVECRGFSLWVRETGAPSDHPVRLRVLARDVSLSLTAPSETSILNAMPARVVSTGADSHPALTLVQVRAGEETLLARVTARSADRLSLGPGIDVWAQIKAVAVL